MLCVEDLMFFGCLLSGGLLFVGFLGRVVEKISASKWADKALEKMMKNG